MLLVFSYFDPMSGLDLQEIPITNSVSVNKCRPNSYFSLRKHFYFYSLLYLLFDIIRYKIVSEYINKLYGIGKLRLLNNLNIK